MTRAGVPVYLKDIADVTDSTEDRRADHPHQRPARHPHARDQAVRQEHGARSPQGVRAEIERINREVPSVRLAVLDDQSKFIERSINSVKEHAAIGGILVVLIIFLFLRNVRSTLIICTSIPISVIGTFALLYFGGYTLNTLTFGGLALGIGMIVDAAIVVLENTYRHLEMGKDRMTAAIDGSEEVWSAILASTLTHIAVFVPMLFLTGVASITFGSLAAVVSFSLAMSLFVAVTIVPVLCSRFLDPPDHGEKQKGLIGVLYRFSERVLNGIDNGYARLLHVALAHRPTVFATGIVLFALALYLGRFIGVELQPTTDEGEVTVDAELAVGTRVEITEAVLIRLEERSAQPCPRRRCSSPRRGGGGMGGLAAAAGPPRQHQRPADAEGRAHAHERTDRDDAAPRAVGASRRHRARAAIRRPADARHAGRQPGRRRQPLLGRSPRPRSRRVQAARAGREDAARLDARHRRLARRPRRRPSGNRGPRRSRQGGHARPVRHRRGQHDPHQPRRHAGGDVPRGGQRVSRSSCGCGRRIAARSPRSATCS